MKIEYENIIKYDSLDVDRGLFSLDKFFDSDGPGTLSWINMEEIVCNSDVPPFDSTKLNKPVIPCRSLCAGCRRWQIESSGKGDLSDIKQCGKK